MRRDEAGIRIKRNLYTDSPYSGGACAWGSDKGVATCIISLELRH